MNTTVNGLGERAGNASLEEFAAAVDRLYHVQTGVDQRQFSALSQMVARASGRPVPHQKSLVGASVFTHESGIHVDGLVKNKETYQGLDPEWLGRQHELVLGKHSGTKAVLHIYGTMGIALTAGQAKSILEKVRSFAETYKRTPARQDLMTFHQQIMASEIAH